MKPNRPDWWRYYCGADYADRGRSMATGFDCWGLVYVVYPAEFNHVVDDFGEVYPLDVQPGTKRGVALARARIESERPGWRETPWEEGAVCLFKVRAQPVHVGIATATKGVLLHAHGSTGVSTLDIRPGQYCSVKWEKRFVACYLPSSIAPAA